MTMMVMMRMMTRATIALQVSPGRRLSLRQDGTRSDLDFGCIHDHDHGHVHDDDDDGDYIDL